MGHSKNHGRRGLTLPLPLRAKMTGLAMFVGGFMGLGAHRVDRQLRLELRGRRADQRPSVEPLSREDPRLALHAESDP